MCAPAGFGKTALLADWLRSGGRPVAWLSLDVGDNDPVRFWRHVVAALDRARPGIGERVAPLLGPPPSSFEGLVTALINELAARPGEDEMVLVLDDYHLVDAQPVHASLAFLLEHLPPGLHLVLASRSDPPLPLARLRARGQLAELRTDDLRFTAEEAADLLRERRGPACRRGGGGAGGRTKAGGGLAAGRPVAAGTVRRRRVRGGLQRQPPLHPGLSDREVLDGQPEQVREFLLETSVLERLSGGLCDAVTGRDDSQAMLEHVEQAGLFLCRWMRFAAGGVTIACSPTCSAPALQQQRPGRVVVLHRAAAAWYQEHGLADDAVGHALAAGDTAWAARLIEQYFDAILYLRSEGATAQRWLAALPAELVQARPRLLLAQVLLAATLGRAEAMEPPLDAAERALAGAAPAVDEPFEPSVGTATSVLGNIPALIALHRGFLAQLRGDAEGTAAFASQALAELAGDERLLGSTAYGLLAAAEWLRGRLAEPSRPSYRASPGGRRPAHLMGRLPARPGSARPGPAGRGRRDLPAGLDIAAASGPPPAPPAGPAYVGLAEVAYQRNELDSALRQVTEGIALPAVSLPRSVGHWPGDPGVDPAGPG